MKEGILPKGKAITFACLGFIFGISVFSLGQIIPELWCLGMVIFCYFCLLISNGKRKLFFSLIFIFALGFFLAGWRYDLSYPVINEEHISFYNGQSVIFSGVINKEPIEKEKGWQLTISNIEKLSDPTATHGQNKTGKVLVNGPLLPVYSYGDRLKINCTLETPESKKFPYDRYLARYGIYSICYRPHITLLKHNQGNIGYAWILKIKKRAYEIAERNLPEPTASLALPVVFGGGQTIPDDITEDFRRTGLTHIMAVSGFNVSLLVVLIGVGFNLVGFRRRTSFYLTSICITAYIIMVGAPASAVRAGVMSLFLLLALVVGRLASLPRSVLLVAVMTLLVNPRLLRDDIGWQLSFLAILGLIYLHPLIQKWGLKFSRERGRWIIDALAATMAAQIATAPVILYNFGQFSVIAPLANLLVVWVVPLLTIMMMVSLALTAIFPSLGLFFFLPCWLMVKYIFFIVQMLSGISWAAVFIE